MKWSGIIGVAVAMISGYGINVLSCGYKMFIEYIYYFLSIFYYIPFNI